MIADDSFQIRRMIRCCVLRIGGEVYECGDGGAALEAFVRHRPDWVLMDIKIPVMDGIKATRRIRASDSVARIIIVTNYNDALLRIEAMKAGGDNVKSRGGKKF